MSKLIELNQDLRTLEYGDISEAKKVAQKYIKIGEILSFAMLKEVKIIISELIKRQKADLEAHINYLENHRCWVIYDRETKALYSTWTGRGYIRPAFTSREDAFCYLLTKPRDSRNWEVGIFGEI